MNVQDFFNWSMTFRHDSDVPIPHGRIHPHSWKRGLLDDEDMAERIEWREYDAEAFRDSLQGRSEEFRCEEIKRLQKKGITWRISHRPNAGRWRTGPRRQCGSPLTATRGEDYRFFLYTYYFGSFGIFRSRRHLYVKELQKYMEVDQLGGCGKRYFDAARKKQP